MCGIAGIISKNKINRTKFDEMVDIIDFRGPDDRGVFYESINGGEIALGHRRLSIIDISSAGHQPFLYKDRYILTYNGEIYNYIELRDELSEKGYSFTTSSDTEVLIACYDCYGKECVNKFNGMWAFAIFDKETGEVFISRDRLGVKPLYYSITNDSIIFGSEIKQILLMLEKGQKVNKKRLFEYLIRGYSDYTEETMIENIFQLRGGNNLIINLKEYVEESKESHLKQNINKNIQKLQNGIVIEKFYDIEKINQDYNSYEEAKKDFESKFSESVNLRLRSDVALGYCLSGGLDSSAIVCTADKIIKDKGISTVQKSISSCFTDKRYDEQEYIDEVLRKTDVDGVKIFPKGDQLLDELDKVIWHMDEPFSSTSQYAQWNVFKGASENNLTVMLDGQGADEQLAGYTGFYSVIFAEYLRRFKFISFFRELKSYKKLRASTEQYVKSYKIIVEALISAYLPRKVQKWGKLKFFYLRRLSPFKKQDIIDTVMGLDLYPANNSRQYILDNIKCNLSMLLRFEDRNSMAFSIESRVPFLDYNLVECIFRMPIEYKIKYGITKRVMRDSLSVLPEKIKTRYSKLGFVTPEDQWINDNPDIYRNELIKACEYLSPIIDKEQVLKWYDSISGNVERMDYTAFRIICAGRWVKIFNLSF